MGISQHFKVFECGPCRFLTLYSEENLVGVLEGLRFVLPNLIYQMNMRTLKKLSSIKISESWEFEIKILTSKFSSGSLDQVTLKNHQVSEDKLGSWRY